MSQKIGKDAIIRLLQLSQLVSELLNLRCIVVSYSRVHH